MKVGACQEAARCKRIDTQTPGRIQKGDPHQGSAIYTIGVLESRIGSSTIRILSEVWVDRPMYPEGVLAVFVRCYSAPL